ncbi:glycosyltransferase family 2 protein [Nonomuraea pusilla]|uniref:glycosyltransferase family 2 protein n=1 Tax=Nonomuraea pusilla TaxID=46177 RepID=UPI003333B1E0
MIPLLSVVVPVYNVEPYITECLKSLAAQTLEDIEVIMVDDGSQDGSRQAAEDFVARDRRFALVGQQRLGPGPARNAGVRLARGVYLAFADADDVVPPEAYEKLVSSLRETGSDLACGAVRRLVDGRLEESLLHEKVFRRPERCTHITDKRVLVRDRTIWNKVYRRDFWQGNGLEYPPGIYEDVPVAMRAHVLASSVDMLGDVVYHWRRREEGETSITQRRVEAPNLVERLNAIRAVRTFLHERAPDLLPDFDALVLEKDTLFLFQALEECRDDCAHLLRLARDWQDELSPEALASAPSLRRLELHLVKRGRLKELRKVREFRRASADGTRVVPRGRRKVGWYGDYPYFRSWRLRIPDEVFDARDELKLVARAEGGEWGRRVFRLRGHVSIHRVEQQVEELSMWLTNGRRELPLECRREGRYGFTTTINPRRLKGHGRSWKVMVRAELKGLTFTDVLRDGESRAAWRFSVPGWSRSGMDMAQ